MATEWTSLSRGRLKEEVKPTAEERLQKVLARAGVASRRRSEQLILDGRVSVNGQTVRQLGQKVDPARDRVEVEGRPISLQGPTYLLLYKPKGFVTTMNDPQGRPKVADLLRDVPVRVFPVGRLDFQTEGLLLLTNDGPLAQALTHPSFGITKTYLALVRGVPGPKTLQTLQGGVQLEDGPTAPAGVRLLKSFENRSLLELKIKEGRNREVRRMCEVVGHPVLHLLRTSLAFLTLGNLRPGQYRHLQPSEIARLKRLARGQKNLPPLKGNARGEANSI